jgi:ribosomal protein L25 (general stress protein Ctc)
MKNDVKIVTAGSSAINGRMRESLLTLSALKKKINAMIKDTELKYISREMIQCD